MCGKLLAHLQVGQVLGPPVRRGEEVSLDEGGERRVVAVAAAPATSPLAADAAEAADAVLSSPPPPSTEGRVSLTEFSNKISALFSLSVVSPLCTDKVCHKAYIRSLAGEAFPPLLDVELLSLLAVVAAVAAVAAAVAAAAEISNFTLAIRLLLRQ